MNHSLFVCLPLFVSCECEGERYKGKLEKEKEKERERERERKKERKKEEKEREKERKEKQTQITIKRRRKKGIIVVMGSIDALPGRLLLSTCIFPIDFAKRSVGCFSCKGAKMVLGWPERERNSSQIRTLRVRSRVLIPKDAYGVEFDRMVRAFVNILQVFEKNCKYAS